MSELHGSALLDRIRANLNSFTTAERKFARYVLATDDLVYRSITAVTEDSGSGYGTIIRFCQKLNFSGFQDFKINLALDRHVNAPATPAKGPGTTLEAAAALARDRLTTTAAALGDDTLAQAASVLASARRIVAVGVGGSFPQAADLAYRLARLKLDCLAVEDSHMQAIRASALGPGDVLVAVSFSGATREVLDAVAQAKAGGATVVAITNYPRSPLADAATLSLAATLWEEVMEAEIGSRLSFCFIVEVLCDQVFSLLPEAGESLRHTAQSVAAKLL